MLPRARVMYRRARVYLSRDEWPFPVREGICAACGAQGRTELHHWRYAYPTKAVRESPRLALHNTVELCYRCHRVADMYRKLSQDVRRAELVNRSLILTIKNGGHHAED